VPDLTGLLQRAYEAFHVGDFERAVEGLADDIRWHMPASEGLPASGLFYGKDEVRWMFAQIRGAFGDHMSARPAEFVESGSTVVVLGNLEGGRPGCEFCVPYATVWRFDEDGVPHRATTMFDTALVRDRLGEEPQGDPPHGRPMAA
jgi:ketosteroid isomerase-like protein